VSSNGPAMLIAGLGGAGAVAVAVAIGISKWPPALQSVTCAFQLQGSSVDPVGSLTAASTAISLGRGRCVLAHAGGIALCLVVRVG
jgi:hypothetical protein